MGDDAVHDLTAAYALDALEPEEARAYERHLAVCARCREEVASLQGAAAALGYAAAPVVPPAGLRERILAAAGAERRRPAPPPRPRFWSRPRPLAAAAALALAAAVALGAWDVSLHDRLGRAGALRGVALTGAAGSVVVGADGGAVLVVAGLPAAPAGKTYEAWVVAGGQAEPAGLFAGGGRAVVVRLARPLPAGAVVAVTLERAGGALRPTRPPILTSRPV